MCIEILVLVLLYFARILIVIHLFYNIGTDLLQLHLFYLQLYWR